MFDAFFNAIAGLLALYYDLPVVGGSYGTAIVLLTLTVMVIVTPLTLKGTRSMMAMQALAPEMKRIQAEYADDRQKMNEVMLEFYKENKINPVGGCLPLLLQAPVFIILYRVINGLTHMGANGFEPKYLKESSALYQSLEGRTEMLSWGLDLSKAASSALAESFITGLPYITMIIAVAATSFIQQKQIQGRNPNAEVPQQQKILLRVMPVFFAFISFRFAAALVVYFLVSNLYRIAQQAYISKTLYGPDSPIAGVIETTATETKKTELSSGGNKKTGGSSKSSSGGSQKKTPSGGGGRSGDPKKARPTPGRITPSASKQAAPRGAAPERKKKRK